MRLITRGPGPHVDVGVRGTLVRVGNREFETADLQAQSAVIVDIRKSGGQIVEGGEGFQVAAIEIPPIRTEEVDTGEVDEDGNPVIERRQIPLGPDLVAVTLWTIQK